MLAIQTFWLSWGAREQNSMAGHQEWDVLYFVLNAFKYCATYMKICFSEIII
jgi:hypothetical protein